MRGELIPVEDFSHGAAFTGMTISPDGKTVAYVQSIKGDQKILMRDLDTGKIMGIEIPNTGVPWVEQHTKLDWLNSTRLLFSLYPNGFSAMDKDGKHYEGLTGRDRYAIRKDSYFNTPSTIYNFYDEKDGTVLMNEYDQAYSVDGVGENQWYAISHPHVLKVNARTGGFERVLKNPGNIEYWMADSNGSIRVAIETSKGVARTIYRESETTPWLPLPGMDFKDPAAGSKVTFIHDYDEKFGYQTLAKYWQEDLDFLKQHMPAK